MICAAGCRRWSCEPRRRTRRAGDDYALDSRSRRRDCWQGRQPISGIAVVVIAVAFFGCAQAESGSLTTKEEFQKFYSDYLTGEGYRPDVDSDGDVSFKREGLTYYIIVTQTDAEFFETALPNIHRIADESDREDAYVAADYSNARSRASKV